MNKIGWTAQDYITGLILFSAVIALTYLMVVSQATDYETPGIVDEKFSEHYDKLNENTETISEMLDSTSGSGGFSLLNTADILLSSTFSVINLIFGSFTSLASQVASIPGDFNIPTSVTAIILVVFLSLITVGIIFTIINAVNKTNRL